MDAVALHEYMLAVSRGSGIFYRNDHRDAAEFRVGHNKISRLFKEILHAGFAQVISEKQRSPKSARYIAGQYKVLSHAEWAKLHPGLCREKTPYPKTGHGSMPQNSDVHAPKQVTVHDPKQGRSMPQNGAEDLRREKRVVLEKRKEEQRHSKSTSTPTPQLSTPNPKPKTTGMGKPEGEYSGMVGPMMHWINGQLAEQHLVLTESSRRWAVDQIAHGMTGAQALRTLSEKAKSMPGIFVAVADPPAPAPVAA